MMAGYGGALAVLLLELGYDSRDAADGQDAAQLRAEALDALFALPSVRVRAFLEWFVASVRPQHSVKRQLSASEYALFRALIRGEHGGLLSDEQLEVEEVAGEQQGETLDDLLERRARLAGEVEALERKLRIAEQKNERLAKLVHKQVGKSDEDSREDARRRKEEEMAMVAGRSSAAVDWSGSDIDVMVERLASAHEDSQMLDPASSLVVAGSHTQWKQLLYQQSLVSLLETERGNLEKINTDVPKILAVMKQQSDNDADRQPQQRTAWFFRNVDPQQLQLQDQDIYLYNRCCVELARLEKAFVASEYDALMAQLELARATERQKQVRDSRRRLVQQYDLMSAEAVVAQHNTLSAALESTRKQLTEYTDRLLPCAFEEMAFLKTTTVLVGSYEQKLWRQERRFLRLRTLVDALDLQYGRLRLTHRLLDEEYVELKRVERTLRYLSSSLVDANSEAQERLQMHGLRVHNTQQRRSSYLPPSHTARSTIKDSDEVARTLFSRLEAITRSKAATSSSGEHKPTTLQFQTFEEMTRMGQLANSEAAKLRNDKNQLTIEWHHVYSAKRKVLNTVREQLFGDATSSAPMLLSSQVSATVQNCMDAKDQTESDLHAVLEDLRIKRRSLAMDPATKAQQQASMERLRSRLKI